MASGPGPLLNWAIHARRDPTRRGPTPTRTKFLWAGCAAARRVAASEIRALYEPESDGELRARRATADDRMDRWERPNGQQRCPGPR